MAIIGVVAALTIPTVVRNYQEKQTVVQLKKVYSQLNQAYQMATINEGPIETWDWGSAADGPSAENILQKFKPYLKVSKYCGLQKGCWQNIHIKRLDGPTYYNIDTLYFVSRLVLADGTSLAVYTAGNTGKRGEFWVDINGNKPPATFGKDIFHFDIAKNGHGVIPWGMPNDRDIKSYCNKDASVGNESGRACAAWVIMKENMDYLRKPISW